MRPPRRAAPRSAATTALLSLILFGACARPPAATVGSAKPARGPASTFGLCPGASVDSVSAADTAIDIRSDRSAGSRLNYLSPYVRPDYPDALKAAGVEGSVVASFVIDTLGRTVPGSALIVQSTEWEFAQSICRVIPRMRFSPFRVAGRPRRVKMTVPFQFALAR